MNNNENTFNLTDSILRILGIFGFFSAVIFGFVVAGGNVLTLVHIPELIIVIGTIFFGLLSTHRSQFLAFLPEALSLALKNQFQIKNFVKFLTTPEVGAAAGGGMVVILSLICTMSNLDDPESVGLRVGAAMGGVFRDSVITRFVSVFTIQLF